VRERCGGRVCFSERVIVGAGVVGMEGRVVGVSRSGRYGGCWSGGSEIVGDDCQGEERDVVFFCEADRG